MKIVRYLFFALGVLLVLMWLAWRGFLNFWPFNAKFK